jgi:predicted heme/steroid binding protein/uncharacterized membrane protein
LLDRFFSLSLNCNNGEESEMKEITSEELISFGGKDGNPVYVAFQGKIYDLSTSPLWSEGVHMEKHSAGRDLSGEISAAPHGLEVFERYPQVGVFKKGISGEFKHLPTMLQRLLQQFPMAGRHPHPMVVHFPIAFLMGTSLFSLLYLLSEIPAYETMSFYLIVLGAISSLFAMATGLFTWWVNYRLKLIYYVKRKIQLSIVLLLLETSLLLWHGLSKEIFLHGINLIYFILMLALAPIVGLLGYYGGQMTFPTKR